MSYTPNTRLDYPNPTPPPTHNPNCNTRHQWAEHLDFQCRRICTWARHKKSECHLDEQFRTRHGPDFTMTCLCRPDLTMTWLCRPDLTMTCLYRPELTMTCLCRPDLTMTCVCRPDLTMACMVPYSCWGYKRRLTELVRFVQKGDWITCYIFAAHFIFWTGSQGISSISECSTSARMQLSEIQYRQALEEISQCTETHQ